MLVRVELDREAGIQEGHMTRRGGRTRGGRGFGVDGSRAVEAFVSIRFGEDNQ